MTDDRTDAALRRLSARSELARPLSSEAQARIEARLDAAFSDASADTDLDVGEYSDVMRLTPARTETGGAARRRRWLAPVATAAAAVVLVLGLVMVRAGDPPPAVDVAGLTRAEFPVELLQSGTRWTLATELIESEGGSAVASLTIRMQGQTAAQARIRSDDVPSREFLGEVRFDVDPTGHVLVPLVLLDPRRTWVDCDATLDLSGSGTTTCRGELVEYSAAAGVDDVVVTPAGRDEAQVIDVDWSDDAVDAARTRLWISPLAGPVRIEVDDGQTTRTYTLVELDAPATSPTPTPAGD